jgi:hypothetical protein
MTQDMRITLETLHCKGKDRNQGSEPYFWPVLMPIEKTEGILKVPAPSSQPVRVVIRASQPGGTGGGPCIYKRG